VLRNYPNRVSIFLHASASFRAKRVEELYHIDADEAAKIIAISDKERGQYISNFSGIAWPDARQFNLCIDTEKTGIDRSVDLIMEYIKNF